MKKNVIAGVMLATAAIFGTSTAFAQAPQNNSGKPECKKEMCKKDKKDGEGKEGRKAMFNPFEGLNLTADQQAKIDALKNECQAQRENAKKEKAEKKEQAKQQGKADRNKMKTEMLAKVKAILTPEQYVQFLENAFINNGGPQGPQKQGMRQGKDHKGGNRDHKGQRPEKNQK